MLYNMKFLRTDGQDRDFAENCRRLDADLEARVGREIQRSKYEKYNQLDAIHEAIVVYEDGVLAGAGAIRRYDDASVELKRIYVSPMFRRKGIAQELVSQLIQWAKEVGYRRMLLETGEKLSGASALSAKLGFERIPNYGPYVDMPESSCMAREIQ